MDPILSFENVSFSYQNKYQVIPAVRDVNVTFSISIAHRWGGTI